MHNPKYALYAIGHPDFELMVAVMRFIEEREPAMWLSLLNWAAGMPVDIPDAQNID